MCHGDCIAKPQQSTQAKGSGMHLPYSARRGNSPSNHQGKYSLQGNDVTSSILHKRKAFLSSDGNKNVRFKSEIDRANINNTSISTYAPSHHRTTIVYVG